jgi:ferrous iron transport protein B
VAAVFVLQSTPVVEEEPFGSETLSVQDSAYGVVSDAISPIFEPAGFGSWSLSGALVTGFIAKEAVISTWAQTYALEDPSDASVEEQGRSSLAHAISQDFDQASGGHSIAAIWAFMIFLLAYTPCVATLATQRREIGWKWTLMGLGLQFAGAWVLAVAVFNVVKIWW